MPSNPQHISFAETIFSWTASTQSTCDFFKKIKTLKFYKTINQPFYDRLTESDIPHNQSKRIQCYPFVFQQNLHMPFLFFSHVGNFVNRFQTTRSSIIKNLWWMIFHIKHQIEITTAANKSYHSVYFLTFKKQWNFIEMAFKKWLLQFKQRSWMSTIFVRLSNKLIQRKLQTVKCSSKQSRAPLSKNFNCQPCVQKWIKKLFSQQITIFFENNMKVASFIIPVTSW